MKFHGPYGLTWDVYLNPWPMAHRGDCDPPWKDERLIRVRKHMPLEELVEVVIHECLHARFWDLDEESVEHFGEECASVVLWALRERGVI